ncbi:MAG: hypothetical protein LBT14_05000 [Treponema sp.]|nr:hypothetical protein [Treponema sp.]
MPKITKPATLELSLAETNGSAAGGTAAGRSVSVNASMDFRSSAPDLYAVNLTGANFPFMLGTSFDHVGIGGFRGRISFTVESDGKRDFSFSAGGSVTVNDAAILEPGNIVVRVVDEALREV